MKRGGKMDNKTLVQYFEWYLAADCSHWKRAARDAQHLAEIGVSGVWLPPAYKGAGGANDIGYGVYDMYDLGEFMQKGTVPTKYGTKDEYVAAVAELKRHGIRVYADIVMNHRMGADSTEQLEARECCGYDRNEITSGEEKITAWTRFTFPGRNGKYSDFVWDSRCFDGVDWDDSRKEKAIFLMDGHSWQKDVDRENGNYDYLMGADVDTDQQIVADELVKWGKWYLDTTGVDAFRLDAVKHIQFDFFTKWLKEMRAYSGLELPAVGEYWSSDLGALTNYLEKSGQLMMLFDVPLHYNLERASRGGGNFDMKTLFDGTLVKTRPLHAVTFVDNHDTQPGQALCSWVDGWFKLQAYAAILLRADGLPCVFYGDLYGIPHDNVGAVGEKLEKLMKLRKTRAYGEEIDYFDDVNIVGWTRTGDEEHENSGLAVIMSDNIGGSKVMSVGANLAGAVFTDALQNRSERITISEDGLAEFFVNGGSISVWTMERS